MLKERAERALYCSFSHIFASFHTSQKADIINNNNNVVSRGRGKLNPDNISLRNNHVRVHERLQIYSLDRVRVKRRPRFQETKRRFQTVFPSLHRFKRAKNGIRTVRVRDHFRSFDETGFSGGVRGERIRDETGCCV